MCLIQGNLDMNLRVKISNETLFYNLNEISK